MEIYTLKGSYNKARVVVTNNKRLLYSYNKKVAEYDIVTKQMKVFGWYSQTTGRHIRKFFELFGLKPLTKQELFKKYKLKE